jgi:formylglycine-generating enzyme required for sulfatase activity
MPNEDSFYNSHKYYRDMFEKDSASDLTVGELFDNQYRIIRKIGAGGMGTVYLVEDILMKDKKALKTIRRTLTKDVNVLERFLQEVALSQRISSKNVIRVHTARQCDDDVYYTMEYLEGQTLRYRLEALHESGETMSLEEIQRIMADVCKGLEDAHQVTLHRDLKPENIFIDEAGRAKLLDFGLARALKGTGLTMDAQKMGTAYYMAPEQLSKKPVKPTAALDIYSLGVIVYEMLTLKVPVGIFRSIPAQRDDVSQELDKFIRHCLNEFPEDRPATASAFFREFDSIISSDIETIRRRKQEEEARLKREEQYKDALARASAAKPDDMDAALRVWQELASNYPEKIEATEKVSEFQKRIRERDEAIRQAELQKQRDRDRQIEVIRNEALNESDTKQAERFSKSKQILKSESHKTQQYDIGDGVSIDMVYIQGGSFLMGSPDDEKGRGDFEGPVHTVELDGFWMSKFPVTQAQYHTIMESNPSNFQKKIVLSKGFLGFGRDVKKEINPNHPVENVSWNDAMEFCRKLSQRTGKTFTLPTEAQWEYACRAGTTTRFYFGDDENRLGEYAWFYGNSNSQTHPVGQKTPNAWGLYDMHGNVFEWCLDWYGSYTSGTKRNPVGPGSGSNRVGRGGCWYRDARGCRSANRDWDAPSLTDYNLGFRLVITDSS